MIDKMRYTGISNWLYHETVVIQKVYLKRLRTIYINTQAYRVYEQVRGVNKPGVLTG